MEDITKELNSATEYLRAMKKSGHHKGDCDNILMHLANIEDLVNKLFIADVVVELPSKKSKEFKRWTQSKGYESAFNGLWYEKNNQTYETNLLHRAFTNEIEFGN